MNSKPLMPVFAATLFVSAFLIFAVQPMVSKMLLPLLGGSPSVWNTAMVFFQAMLLAGYAYAHLVARFIPLKLQGILHVILLLFFTTALPLALPAGAQPPADGDQALWQLATMMACVGGPFFVLAASAPLFQHWFSASSHETAQNPYFLYAVSNAGSMLSLLSYPLIIEPLLGLPLQTHTWFFGYIALIGLTISCAILIRNGVKPVMPLTSSEERKGVSWTSRLIWIFLAFVPSSLMLGVTTLITTDLTSAPFLWIIPLALYLGTFIIAFSQNPCIKTPVAREIAAYGIAVIILTMMMSGFSTMQFPIIIMHLAIFFICAQLCHGELANAKPSTSHLTEYFLLISFGGVLGGVFNALIAPRIFMIPLEYSLTLATIPFIIWAAYAKYPLITNRFNAIEDKSQPKKLLMADICMLGFAAAIIAATFFFDEDFMQVIGSCVIFTILILSVRHRRVYALICLMCLLVFQPTVWGTSKDMIGLDRNYFGVLKVYSDRNINFFYHGTTLHGAQSQEEKFKFSPVTYYSPGGPASDLFNYLDERKGNEKIAGLGLGVGSIACYKAPGRHFDFYEIDADVVRIAEDTRYFSYLKGCGNYSIVLGDARLKINEAKDHSYDMIFIDTFSSDNIPIHIMTKEAFEIYLKKLAPHGIIGMNISNRYFDLRPVLTSIAKDLGMTVYFKYHKVTKVKGDISELYTPSLFAVMAPDTKDVAPFMEQYEWKPAKATDNPVRAWTDDYANILSSLFIFQ